MKVPQEISNQVISMFLEGKSESEIMKLSRLSEDQVHNVLSELVSREYQNTVTYLLAVKYGKDGRDMKESMPRSSMQ
jgi:DNA invertase Pin-like site-specific DNA recombinase